MFFKVFSLHSCTNSILWLQRINDLLMYLLYVRHFLHSPLSKLLFLSSWHVRWAWTTALGLVLCKIFPYLTYMVQVELCCFASGRKLFFHFQCWILSLHQCFWLRCWDWYSIHQNDINTVFSSDKFFLDPKIINSVLLSCNISQLAAFHFLKANLKSFKWLLLITND